MLYYGDNENAAALKYNQGDDALEIDMAEIEYLLECANKDEIKEMLIELRKLFKPLHR